MRELYSAMLEDAQQNLVAGMERAAQRCVKKAELKVQYYFKGLSGHLRRVRHCRQALRGNCSF